MFIWAWIFGVPLIVAIIDLATTGRSTSTVTYAPTRVRRDVTITTPLGAAEAARSTR